MAFRSEAKTCACLILMATALGAAPKSYNVVHKHLRHGGAGVLKIDDAGITFTESGKGSTVKDSRVWKFEDIQELRLGPDFLRILTYEPSLRTLNRDRAYVFERTPAAIATEWYPIFRAKLDKRFVAALADPDVVPEWQMPVRGGTLVVGKDRIVFKSVRPGESRTWRMSDVESVGSSGPFDLTISVLERTFRFQLKEEMSDSRYQALWMRVTKGQGLKILGVE